MKFSEKWLRKRANPQVSHDRLVARLSMVGLEVDADLPVAGAFSGVVVGEVLSTEQHPDADKLRVCQVSNGSETFQVVCGAPNVRAGLKIPFAMIGAELPGDFKIKKAKLRGVESFGMLCSAKELQISEENAGLLELPADAPVGQDVRTYLELDDYTIEVGLTPNRGDCLSLAGLAREVSAIYDVPLAPVAVDAVAAQHDETRPVELAAPAACPRYLGRVIRNVDLSRPTPLWMVERLRRSDIRSIDPVVDVTNYVMIELGQPMHAFDLAEINGGVRVRMAEDGEKLVLLDGQEITLRTDTLVIADHQRALAIAGVMGGEHSGVSDSTRDLFLEAAFFDTIALAGKARSYGLHTDSSHRFERGVDSQLARKAMERATRLILDIVGGEPGPIVEQVSEAHLPKVAPITLRAERVTQMLGMPLDAAEIVRLLQALEADGGSRRGRAVVSRRTEPSLRHFPGSRPDRGTGPSLRLQPPAGALPAGAPGAEQQAGSARRAAAAAAPAGRPRLPGSDHLQLHRSGPVRTVRSGHPAADPGQPDLRRHGGDAFQPLAGPGQGAAAQPQPPAVAGPPVRKRPALRRSTGRPEAGSHARRRHLRQAPAGRLGQWP